MLSLKASVCIAFTDAGELQSRTLSYSDVPFELVVDKVVELAEEHGAPVGYYADRAEVGGLVTAYTLAKLAWRVEFAPSNGTQVTLTASKDTALGDAQGNVQYSIDYASTQHQ